MKGFVKSLFFLLIFSIVLAISYFYTPSSVKVLNEKITRSDPVNIDENRSNLIKEYDNVLMRNLPENNPLLYSYWYSSQRKISDLRIKEVIREIKSSGVESGKIKFWVLVNMGVVIKTNSRTVAIDVANLPFSNAHNELADLVDVFIVTHMDGDHYDPALLKKALAKNKKIVLLNGFTFTESANVIKLLGGETKNLDGLKITAYQTDHRGDGNFLEPSAWFIIEIDGYKLLHTGDGRDFKNKEESKKVYAMKDFAILLGNNTLHPYNIRDLKPKVFIPLHLYKFMSGGDLYQESTIEAVSKNYEKYKTDLRGINIQYLLPGESYTYR